MNRHICLPKSTLKEYMQNQRLYYLDIQENLIKNSTAEEFNAEENYYPDDSEAFLSKEVETHIGRLRKRIKDYELGRASIKITPSLTERLIRIFIIQSIRVPDFRRITQSKSVFANILGLPESYYSPLHHGVDMLKKYIEDAYSSITSSIFKSYSANTMEITKDNRKRSFLLPSSHFIGIGKWLMLVLTPYWGMLLIPESENIHLMQKEELRYLAATNDYDVDLINKEAEKYESTLSNPKLVGLLPELELLMQRRT